MHKNEQDKPTLSKRKNHDKYKADIYENENKYLLEKMKKVKKGFSDQM